MCKSELNIVNLPQISRKFKMFVQEMQNTLPYVPAIMMLAQGNIANSYDASIPVASAR